MIFDFLQKLRDKKKLKQKEVFKKREIEQYQSDNIYIIDQLIKNKDVISLKSSFNELILCVKDEFIYYNYVNIYQNNDLYLKSDYSSLRDNCFYLKSNSKIGYGNILVYKNKFEREWERLNKRFNATHGIK